MTKRSGDRSTTGRQARGQMMAEKRMTSERRAEIEARNGTTPGAVIDRHDLLAELAAVEKENRTLREALEEARGYLTHWLIMCIRL